MLSREQIRDDDSSEETFDPDTMTECQGKYMRMTVEGDGLTPDRTYRFFWFDADGNELGTTEVQVRKEDFPQFANSSTVRSFGGTLVPAGDYLWQLFDIWEQTDNFEKTQASYERYMFRVPLP